MQEDKELREYRNLMLPPEQFEDGFGIKSVLGAVFVGMIMMPGAMYMGLVAGSDLGPAARWVTVILFMEVARRAFSKIRRAELFVLYYMAGAAISSPFSGLLWNQFLVQSEPARNLGISQMIPSWVAPGRDVLDLRNFFLIEWLAPISLLILTQLITRIDHFGLGYALYRITSDVEKLPFPLAPVHALGVTALAESADTTKGSWRWRVFSIGGMLGLVFGAIYIGLPSVTGVMFHTPLKILPIPWTDLTTSTEGILPAVPMGLSLDLSHLLVGMVLPFWAMAGEFGGFLITLVANPIMQSQGVLDSWEPGMETIQTQFLNTVDFYYSFGIGIAGAIAVIGFWHMFSALREQRRANQQETGTGHWHDAWKRLLRPSVDRGDIPFIASVGIYVFSTTSYILLCKLWLIPNFPLYILLIYGFVYTPLISYVSARMEGVVGQQVNIPMVREGVFILSGYQGVDVWFAPIPEHNYASRVVEFRTVELTGTRFSSIIKAELVVFPVVMIASICFAQFIWRLAPIPSVVYPYTQKIWELQALNMCLTYSSTMGQDSIFYEAFKPPVIALGAGLGLGAYGLLSQLGLPVMLVYGLVRGLGATLPHIVVPHFIGALLGRYYFRKKFGVRWGQYGPVVLAGFTCGMGLVSMLALGIVFLGRSVVQTSY